MGAEAAARVLILAAVPPRFDPERGALELSVGDLLDATLLRSLGFANRGGYERLWLGQAIHSRYQEDSLAADPGYQREVAVAATFPHRGCEVTVHGRLDGLRRETDGALVVEEIKSVRRGGSLSPAVRQLYQRQAALYAWLLKQRGESEVRAELVLIEIGSEVVEREPVELSFPDLESSVRQRLNALLRTFESEQAAAADRRAAATRLDFPYPSLRSGQGEIVEAVTAALDRGEHLLIEAPTGIGKTVAALLPALRHALENDRRIFVLTAKTLQQEMATTVLELLNPERAFRSLQLRAKAKMCANDQLLCHEEYCRFAKEYYSKLHGSRLVPRLLDEAGTLLPDPIFEAARQVEVCPFEVSLELTGKAQVVVCDYNYAFDPYVALSEFGADSDLDSTLLIIDEIHNLVERGRGYYSPALAAAQARAAGAALGRGGAPIHARIAAICESLARLVERTVDERLEEAGPGAEAAEAPLPEDELWALRPAFDALFVDYLEYRRETSSFRAEDPFVALYFDLLRFLNGLLWSEGEAFSRCVEAGAEGPRLRVLCKDPSAFLGRVLNRTHAAIGLSATLSPTDFYRDLLGFDPERFATLSLPSPFPAANRRIVVDPSVPTRWRQREAAYPLVAERLTAFAAEVPGNCLVLFPSYQFLDRVARRLRVPGKQLMVQSRASSDREREAMLDTLRGSLLGNVLLLAVAGGVFAEGVDYPGEMLRAVAVVGPCLPAVSLERELLKRYYQERFERGFEYAFVVPGMTRVVQAAGRLIRSDGDTGVIALLGERFLTHPYRRHLPTHWLDGADVEALAGDPAAATARFFADLGARTTT